jgi:hypothetical protein
MGAASAPPVSPVNVPVRIVLDRIVVIRIVRAPSAIVRECPPGSVIDLSVLKKGLAGSPSKTAMPLGQ